MSELATKFVLSKTNDQVEFKKDKLEQMYEGFLDTIFELESRLSRDEFEKAVVDKQIWIFNSGKI